MNSKQKAFLEKLYDKNYNRLFGFAYKHLNNVQQAEDLTMDTIATAVSRIDSVMNSPNPDGWLMATLKHKIRDENRALARRPEVIPYELHENSIASDSFVPPSVMDCLTDDEEKLARFIYDERRSVAEAATELHISSAACKKRLQRIRDKIKIYLIN